MATQTKFYHQDTERKLQAIEDYLQRFLQVMQNQTWSETIYIDAFAGSGSLPIRDEVGFLEASIDADELILGSAMRALNLDRKFDRYVFIEKSNSKIEELKKSIPAGIASQTKIEFLAGDANEELLKLCPTLAKSKVRAVVFLDPFGNQVSWELLKALAATEHVDLWYLFPSMLGVYRQIGNVNAKMEPEQVSSLNRLFGPNDWRAAFIKREIETDLFGNREVESKNADVEDITRFKIKCLKEIFQGGVSDKWLPLGRNKSHWYSLLFAMANPSPSAVKAGHAIAKSILTKK